MFAIRFRDLFEPTGYRCGEVQRNPEPYYEDYLSNAFANFLAHRLRQSCAQTTQKSESEASNYQVTVNVKHFRPDEIEVKTVDNFVVVHCKHEEIADQHGFVTREFRRRYQLPDDVDHENVKSILSKDGVLTIQAPRKVIEPPKIERVIPITIQQPADLKEAGDMKLERLQHEQQQTGSEVLNK